MLVESQSHRLLNWYDNNARALPWRNPPGAATHPDPYRVWLSEIMLQQTTVAAVAPYFAAFVARWPTVEALAAADDAEVMAAWAGLGYYARARNLLACARAVTTRHGGRFPSAETTLLTLPGIGTYTAAAIAAIAFDQPAVVVDSNVERVVSRLFAIRTPLPAAKQEIRARAAELTPLVRPGDYAQAMMDLGAMLCTPRSPACWHCPIAQDCTARAAGSPEAFPAKAVKPKRPLKRGTVFWLEAEAHVLLVTRPPKGLLGGMTALPTGAWEAAEPDLSGAPAPVDWHVVARRIRHGFTHFELVLDLATAKLARRIALPGRWHPVAALESAGLPTVFRRAAEAALRPTLV